MKASVAAALPSADWSGCSSRHCAKYLRSMVKRERIGLGMPLPGSKSSQ